MNKLLYISANSKPENLSTSKTVGREFINRFKGKNPDYIVEEIDLYNVEIPEANYKIFTKRAELVSGDEYNVLEEQEKKMVDRVNVLCDQFLSADIYVIAAPMWSLSYPSRLKQYIDCIVLNGKLIKVTQEEVRGLLDNRNRDMIYIQSSGGVYPKIFSGKFNHGVDYVHDLFKFLGVNRFERVLVQGVDDEEVGRQLAIKLAYEAIDDVIDKISRDILSKV